MVEPKPVPVTYPLPDPPRKPGSPRAGERGGKGEGKKRDVRLATWLSVVPGLGQLYNRQPKRAAFFLLAVVGLFVITLNIPGVTAELLVLWQPRGSFMVILSLVLQMMSLLLFMATFLFALIFWYDAMHDARRTAQEVNGERAPRGRWWWFHR